MLAAERHARIAQAVQGDRVVSTVELAELLRVSTETIRRDLAELETKGLLRRVRGGATRTNHLGDEAPFAERSGSANEAKSVIGTLALSVLQPGQTVVIDVGTTAMQVARALAGEFTGVVLTCSVLVANELAEASGIEVHLSAGRMRKGDLALSGPAAQNFFDDVFADVAFLGSGGVHAEAGLTDFYLDECHVRRIIMRNSAMNYVLADSGKHQRIAPYRVAPLEQTGGVITDRYPPEELARTITGAGGRIICPDSAKGESV
ncbi:DeoR family transcriptional regulator [Tamaricihabitans halophyticus]|uniref:DeoR family transcriptional regulator n=1 Tax=Tamaricihabitans halophyticus TaxID=1262583 RepID=A0A4R2QGW3_9PSEU|nr:DeoR/GlpR family DNA-binding transcription regulator [Tamaricihabitans halophyticus]TCP48473.1 DeoR family transcriptional regulator [Tamaricihabitans halophyticus]